MMAHKINKAWRILATAIAFSVFGLGGLILPVIGLPVIWLSSRDRLVRERRAKAYIHYIMRGFIEMMRGLGILTYDVGDKADYNRPGQLILANHPSLIDVVFLLAFVRRADCVVRSGLTRNVFTRFPIGMAGYIANDDPEQVIEQAAQSLARGNSLIIFPEGTRTRPGQPLQMRRGAANVAVRTGVDVTPVVIRVEPTTLTKNTPWYRVPERRFHMSMDVRPPIHIAPYTGDASPSIMARHLTQHLYNYFTRELQLDERPGTTVEAVNH